MKAIYNRWSYKLRSDYGLHLDQLVTAAAVMVLFAAFDLLSWGLGRMFGGNGGTEEN